MSFQLTHRKVAAILAGVAVFSIVQLSAATLGGATSETLQANTSKVASRENGVTVSYSIAYSSALTSADGNGTTGGFAVKGTTVTANDATPFKANDKVTIVLSDDNGKVLAQGTQTIGSSDAQSANIQISDTVNVESVKQVAVAVNGQDSQVTVDTKA